MFQLYYIPEIHQRGIRSEASYCVSFSAGLQGLARIFKIEITGQVQFVLLFDFSQFSPVARCVERMNVRLSVHLFQEAVGGREQRRKLIKSRFRTSLLSYHFVYVACYRRKTFINSSE